MIVNSDIDKDWGAVGWRGIMLDRGQVWLNYDGKIKAVNYQSDIEKKIKNEIIEVQKNSLHESVRQYVKPEIEWKTRKYRIRIDDIGDYRYRYVSWGNDKEPSDRPDMILLNGEVTFDGSGGNHYYIFQNGNYQYKCYVSVIGTGPSPPGNLEVFKDDELIFSEPVIEVLGR